MTALDPLFAPVYGLIDRGGRLVEADPRLAALNARAGGRLGEAVAIPQIATLARLAQRLDILIARGISAGDGDEDLELWVRAEPEEAGVRLAVTGWSTRPGWQPEAPGGDHAIDFARTAAAWTFETDAALHLTAISLAAGPRHGFDANALLGRPLTRLFALDADAEGGFPILGGLAQHRGFDHQPATVRATGQRVRLAATPRTDDRGGFAGFAGAVYAHESDVPVTAPPQPITGALATQLEAALRAPLDRIIANADSISAESEGPLSRDYVDYANDIASAGRHLAGLVDDLVDLHYIERPDFTVAAEPLDLADVARRAAGLFGVRAAEGQVTLDPPAPDELLPATGEFRRALQVLVNLVGNAVRYSPAGGTLWVRVQREGARAAVIVADQGKGIAEDDQVRIFEKFARVDASEPGGSGLGLYIARRLARAMGGDLIVDSAPDEGARFVFTLPYRG